jgi:hypothetical protein
MISSEHSTAQHSTAQHSTAQHSTAQHSTALRGKKLGLKYSRKSSKKSISFVIKYVAYLWGQKLGLKLPEIQKKNFQFCQI